MKNKFPFITLKEKDLYNRSEKRACEMGGVSVREKQYKGTISTVKPQTSWAEMACWCPLCPGLPHTSEHVYTPRLCYNHLLQEKQALFFEPAAKKKPLLPPYHSERRTQTASLPQPRNPTTGWSRKTEQKMTGDKSWGGKRFIFFL